jgi:hypothetical protein
MARAHSIAGIKAECEKYLQLAKRTGENIEKKEDKNHYLSELKTINCLRLLCYSSQGCPLNSG